MKAAYTIITTDYISYAKTLGDSIIKYNVNYCFYICLIGQKKDLDITIDIKKFTVIELNELKDKTTIQLMQSQYSAFELSCALKPYFAEHILKYNTIDRLKYFDSDIMIFNSFDKDIETNATSSIFLTPHFFSSVDPIENNTNDITLLKSGVYNAGYFEVANTSITMSFLNWWKDRLSAYCYYYKRPFAHVFVDQSWLNLVPVYFKNTFIIDNLGYNASFYNLHERKISNTNGSYLINENKPLIFFHFTGYKYYKHEQASIHNPKYNYENTPFLKSICDEYKESLLGNFIELTSPPIADNHQTNTFTNMIGQYVNGFLRRYLKLQLVKADS